MKKFKLILIISLISIFYSNINALTFNKDSVIDKRIKGSLLLTTEYIIVPLYMKHIWWSQGFRLVNPFYQIDEREPYHVDESWHATMNCAMQDVHYFLLKNYFDIKSPWPSMGLTAFTWFMVEFFDSIEKEDKYGFSINDEIGNLLGLFTWYARYKYPNLKFYIRGGVRKWGAVGEYIKGAPMFFTNTQEYYKKYGSEKYALSKVEFIYKPYKDFFGGIALSKTTHKETDEFGVCLGWDPFSYNFKDNSKRDRFIRFLDRTFALNLEITVWTNKKISIF